MECNIMHFRNDKISVKSQCSSAANHWYYSVRVTMNHQCKSALEKDIEFIRQNISRRGKENQYCCISHRWGIFQISHLDIRNIIWVSCAQTYGFKLEYIQSKATAMTIGLDFLLHKLYQNSMVCRAKQNQDWCYDNR